MLAVAARSAVDLLFPARCAICSAGGALLCQPCADALPRARGRRCRTCASPISTRGPLCEHCAQAPPCFARLRAPFALEGGVRDLVHELKYGGLTSLAAPMGTLLVASVPAAIDVVAPVPLFAARQRARGYNQAALLAGEIARAYTLPFDARALLRVRDTAPLARTMHRDERRDIMRDAFRAAPDRVAARRVLLIDDVATTGATLDSCAGALLAAGAASVECLAFARAGDGRELAHAR
ncbi:MAG: ComF family protein [Chloroflexi bacterium]|nr:ComF family protein [Chloroflexota bacterium]